MNGYKCSAGRGAAAKESSTRCGVQHIWRFALGAIPALLAVSASAASWASHVPDPEGERAYRTHILTGMIPLAILVVGILVAMLILRVRRKHKTQR